jgi:hypothetical protein
VNDHVYVSSENKLIDENLVLRPSSKEMRVDRIFPAASHTILVKQSCVSEFCCGATKQTEHKGGAFVSYQYFSEDTHRLYVMDFSRLNHDLITSYA